MPTDRRKASRKQLATPQRTGDLWEASDMSDDEPSMQDDEPETEPSRDDYQSSSESE